MVHKTHMNSLNMLKYKHTVDSNKKAFVVGVHTSARKGVLQVMNTHLQEETLLFKKVRLISLENDSLLGHPQMTLFVQHLRMREGNRAHWRDRTF